ncbi:MAG: EAL domain-containing protein [Deltaproteobacteria bacterium]|nr:EAL domain-containing protein [Deltaproteobacteria bacterium]
MALTIDLRWHGPGRPDSMIQPIQTQVANSSGSALGPSLPLSLSDIEVFLASSQPLDLACCPARSLASAFQPIFSLAHKRIVGFEALIRPRDGDGRALPPPVLFNDRCTMAELTALDRMSRFVHLLNFEALNDGLSWLFLNIHPQVVVHGHSFGSFFEALLDRFNFPAHRVVVEIVEHPITDNELLLSTVEYYRSLGCLIALDDFGAGGSNFERVWNLGPHIVKFDRSFVLRAASRGSIRDILPGLVHLFHQAGSLVLMEGVETSDQALIALEAGADFVQGFHFARPLSDPDELLALSFDFRGLFAELKARTLAREEVSRRESSGWERLFRAAGALVHEDGNLSRAADLLFRDPQVVRCFLLTPDGVQIGQTIPAPTYHSVMDPRFAPVEAAAQADWFRRPYLRRALREPGRVQITRPYLSITGAHMCVTLSLCLEGPTGPLVLCCDLDWRPA